MVRTWKLGLGLGISVLLGACGDDGGVATAGSTGAASTTTGVVVTTSGEVPTTGTPITTEAPTTTAVTGGMTTGGVPVCGDGMIDPGEDCDDGAGNGPDKVCTDLCKMAACGDGQVGPGEGCDNGADNADELVARFADYHSPMQNLLVADVDAWWAHVQASGVVSRYGVRLTDIETQPWRMRDFCISDPSGVLWRIGQNIG